MNKEDRLSDADIIMKASMNFNEVFRKTTQRDIKELGLTNLQMDVLGTLDMYGSMKMSDLSDKIYVAREQATRAVKSLQDQGLVESKRSEENRKNVVASLLPKGKKMFDTHIKKSLVVLESYLDQLSPEDRENLISHSEAASGILKRNNFFPGSKS